ncbi:hypothetical protein CYMTET_14379 [Cymbomonas tetramitiformis]|uniref:Uncharacterized protein n=1 Tax=Cymbomonas tetramitiformis TaxID=36881 RepID=A0AAE0L9Z2_9CHLO|nr:hypothetical protein CYMTET_14379 [Cymbomonas tetramitiformis]
MLALGSTLGKHVNEAAEHHHKEMWTLAGHVFKGDAPGDPFAVKLEDGNLLKTEETQRSRSFTGNRGSGCISDSAAAGGQAAERAARRQSNKRERESEKEILSKLQKKNNENNSGLILLSKNRIANYTGAVEE